MHSGIIRKIHLYEFLNIPMRQTSLAHFPKPYFLLLNFRFSVYLSFALSVAEAAFLCVVHGCDGFANVVRTQSKKMSSLTVAAGIKHERISAVVISYMYIPGTRINIP